VEYSQGIDSDGNATIMVEFWRWIMYFYSLMADLQIAAKVGVLVCCITTLALLLKKQHHTINKKCRMFKGNTHMETQKIMAEFLHCDMHFYLSLPIQTHNFY